MGSERTQELITHMTWGEVKNKFIECVETGKWSGPAGSVMDGLANRWHSKRSDKKDHDNKWSGGTPDETLDWLKNGFYSDEFEHTIGQKHNIKQTSIVWNEDEGDFDMTRAMCGYDDLFLGVVQAPSLSGIKILIDFDFNCNVGVGVIREYGAFCASLINSLMESGFDTEIDIVCGTVGALSGYRDMSSAHIRVKEFGEVMDFTEFSALFAPTGFRHLNFTAIGLCGDKQKKAVTAGLGHAKSDSWAVEYDEMNRVVHLHCSGNLNKFPGGEMQEAAIEAGIM